MGYVNRRRKGGMRKIQPMKKYCTCKDSHVCSNGMENMKCAYCGKLIYGSYLIKKKYSKK
jgi:hypothetical protein